MSDPSEHSISSVSSTSSSPSAVVADDSSASAVSGADSRRFSSVARVYGEAGAARLARSHVVVVGIGGVGSWAAEALARSGVGRLTLIDLDHVAESNINRQVHALSSTLGAAKVEVMAARIHDISPACTVRTVDASKNKLHIEVLAQSNNSGGDSSSVDSSNGNSSGESSSGGSSSNNNGGGSNIYHYDHLQGKPKSCYTKAGADVQYSTTSVDLGAEWTRTVDLTKAGKRFL